MLQINKNQTLEVLQELIDHNIQSKLEYMPHEFNEQQQEVLELFRKRVFLEKTIEETIAFNRTLNFEGVDEHVKLTTTAEQLVDVFRLRSEVYTGIGYQNEFPDTIEGMNFDEFDSNAAVIYCQRQGQVTATTRLIYDSEKKLPSEEKFSFDSFRNRYGTIGELSRLIVKNESGGLSLEFKALMGSIYHLFMQNEIDITLLGIKKEHYKLYTRFGGSQIIRELPNYGNLDIPALILSWNPAEVSPFFKKVFL